MAPSRRRWPHWLSRLFAPLRSGHYWSYLLHGLIINLIVSTVTFSLAVTWWATTLGGLTYWFWQAFLPDPSVNDWPGWLQAQLPFLQGATVRAVESVAYLGTGDPLRHHAAVGDQRAGSPGASRDRGRLARTLALRRARRTGGRGGAAPGWTGGHRRGLRHATPRA